MIFTSNTCPIDSTLDIVLYIWTEGSRLLEYNNKFILKPKYNFDSRACYGKEGAIKKFGDIVIELKFDLI